LSKYSPKKVVKAKPPIVPGSGVETGVGFEDEPGEDEFWLQVLVS
jgi:hypothetical protein